MLHFPFNFNYPPKHLSPKKKNAHHPKYVNLSGNFGGQDAIETRYVDPSGYLGRQESMRSTWGSSTYPPPAPNLTLPAIAGLMIRAVLSPESGRLFVRGRVGCSMLFLEQGSYEWTQFVSVKTGKCPVFMATFGQDREGKMDMKIMHLHFLEVGGLSPENR